MFGKEIPLNLIDYILLWSAAATAVLGTGIRVVLGIRYSRLIDEVDKMTTTRNRDLKRCKVKYEKCHAMNQGVANVGAFVDRFLSKLSLGPFTYLALYQMGAQMILLSVILMALLICHRILAGESLLHLLPYYAACFAGLYVFLTITLVVNVQEKRNVLKISLVDYLENHLTARLESVPSNLAKIRGDSPVTPASMPEATKPLPKVAVNAAVRNRAVPAAPVTLAGNKSTKQPEQEATKMTTHDYQELSKLLEDFFAV